MGRTIDHEDMESSRKKRKLEDGRAVSEPALASSDPDERDAPPPVVAFKQVEKPEFIDKYAVALGSGAEVYYQEDFIYADTASKLFEELDELDSWYRPTLKVYGKSVVQSRAIAAYSTEPGFTLKYSGQVVDMHYPYPPFLREIQSQVEKALGVTFNHVMLNRYDDGTVYIGKHSDHVENLVIASLSVGAERTFIVSPRKGHTGRTHKWVLKNGSLVVMQGDTQRNWKHEIPKEPKIKQGRISLTFRQLVNKSS